MIGTEPSGKHGIGGLEPITSRGQLGLIPLAVRRSRGPVVNFTHNEGNRGRGTTPLHPAPSFLPPSLGLSSQHRWTQRQEGSGEWLPEPAANQGGRSARDPRDLTELRFIPQTREPESEVSWVWVNSPHTLTHTNTLGCSQEDMFAAPHGLI